MPRLISIRVITPASVRSQSRPRSTENVRLAGVGVVAMCCEVLSLLNSIYPLWGGRSAAMGKEQSQAHEGHSPNQHVQPSGESLLGGRQPGEASAQDVLYVAVVDRQHSVVVVMVALNR